MNNNLPLRDLVFNTLRHAILLGELKPGERLMEIKLGKRLGVSRTPIREAIRMLELEGLVIMTPRKGAEVSQITKKDLEDVLEVRSALEKLAIELACRNITKAELLLLRQANLEFKEAVKENDITLLAEKDVAFHDIIFSATGNRRLIQMINNLREQMYRYRLEYLKDEKSREGLIKEHETILYNLEQRDTAAAKQNIVLHIYNQVKAVSKFIETDR